MGEYAGAVLAHSDIVQTFHEAQRKPNFEVVLGKGESARLVASAARLAFDTDVAEHGCAY